MFMYITPFAFDGYKPFNTVNFKHENKGISIQFRKSPLPNTLSLSVTPIYISNIDSISNNWSFDFDNEKIIGLPLENLNCARFINTRSDGFECISDFFDVFFGTDVLRLRCEYKEGKYILHVKQGYWNGRISRFNGKRIVESSNEKSIHGYSQFDASFDLLNAPTIYQLLQKQKKEAHKLTKKEKNKEKVNRLLKHIGLQLSK